MLKIRLEIFLSNKFALSIKNIIIKKTKIFLVLKNKNKMTETKTSEVIQRHNQMVDFVRNLLMNVENDLKRINVVVDQLANFDPENPDSLTSMPGFDETVRAEDLSSCQDDENMQVVE